MNWNDEIGYTNNKEIKINTTIKYIPDIFEISHDPHDWSKERQENFYKMYPNYPRPNHI